MGIEIERKFLVDAKKISAVRFTSEEKISQGYLANNPTVRVRLKNNRGFLTIKTSTIGITRGEFEYEIPAADAEELLKLCGVRVLKKIRRKISYGGHVWEVDFFEGRLKGLILAEVELSSPNESVYLPNWVIREVSSNPRYFNSNLVKSGLRRNKNATSKAQRRVRTRRPALKAGEQLERGLNVRTSKR